MTRYERRVVTEEKCNTSVDFIRVTETFQRVGRHEPFDVRVLIETRLQQRRFDPPREDCVDADSIPA